MILAFSGMWLTVAVVGSMIVGALAIVGVLAAAISCTDKPNPKGLTFAEWKDGRMKPGIAPYSHANDI